MDIQIREYNQTDKSVLLELTKKLGEHGKSLDALGRIKNLPGFFETSLKATLTKVDKYQGKIWFALDDNRIVGFIIGVIWKQSEENKLEIGPHTLGEVLDLYIEEEYRGKGIGTKLLKKRSAIACGLDFLQLMKMRI